jgi:lipoprotein-anchoring transpeptidase ErfK/SrfK
MMTQLQTDTRQAEGRRARLRARVVLAVAAAGVILAAGAAYAVLPGIGSARGTAPGSAGGAAQAASQHRAGAGALLRVLSITPGNSAEAVTAADPVRVVFSAPLAASSPLPTFSPPVAGTWHAGVGNAMVFTPQVPLDPTTEVTLRVPAGPSGVRSAGGARLAAPATAVFQAGGSSILRTEQLLAGLGYLPLGWTPGSSTGVPSQSGPVTASYRQPLGVAAAGAGTFTWRGTYPAALTSQWQPGQPGVILTGALMAFQSDHALPMTGTATPAVIQALLTAAAKNQRNRNGYNFALATKSTPETLTVWHDGRIVSHGLANTGTAATPTPDGTYPVYLRRSFQIMRGLMPNGTPYADPAHYVSFFHGNYAVHSMTRPSYGHPQSLGCVELPLTEARQVWPYLSYGTLVTVTG